MIKIFGNALAWLAAYLVMGIVGSVVLRELGVSNRVIDLATIVAAAVLTMFGALAFHDRRSRPKLGRCAFCALPAQLTTGRTGPGARSVRHCVEHLAEAMQAVRR